MNLHLMIQEILCLKNLFRMKMEQEHILHMFQIPEIFRILILVYRIILSIRLEKWYRQITFSGKMMELLALKIIQQKQNHILPRYLTHQFTKREQIRSSQHQDSLCRFICLMYRFMMGYMKEKSIHYIISI